MLALDFEYITKEKSVELIQLTKEIQKMIKGFMFTLK